MALPPSTDETERYGADATEWLKRWDAGDIVWTIEMGGMGPGYEQAIQITAAEVVRYLTLNNVDCSEGTPEGWKELDDEIDRWLWQNETVKKLGLSGAQAGAAKNLAVFICKLGPAGVMADERVKDRHIQAMRSFPVAFEASPL